MPDGFPPLFPSSQPAWIYGVRLSLPLKSQLVRYRMQVLFTAAALAGQDLR